MIVKKVVEVEQEEIEAELWRIEWVIYTLLVVFFFNFSKVSSFSLEFERYGKSSSVTFSAGCWHPRRWTPKLQRKRN